jgi:hypothetical protein
MVVVVEGGYRWSAEAFFGSSFMWLFNLTVGEVGWIEKRYVGQKKTTTFPPYLSGILSER